MANDQPFSKTGWLSFSFHIDYSNQNDQLLIERIIELTKASGRSNRMVFSDTEPQSTLDPRFYNNPR